VPFHINQCRINRSTSSFFPPIVNF
jgi:hypothetical protein